ncbi:MAG: enoyl-CoA hydratase-related protein [Bacteroidales bacterium]|jgi:enoyl-CoA hydratase|nr:enoyl-CoA hydratase-related protein [Bacteroidales bacterium]
MESKMVLCNTEDGICTVTINNPGSLNALNSSIIHDLGVVFDNIKDDDSVTVVIITGEGRSFVAGADIEEMANMSSIEGREFGRKGSTLFSKIETFPKPVIAAVNGFALGGGCELALACDIRIASERAKFGQPEVSLGITPGFSGCVRLPRVVGIGIAKEMIFTGKVIDAAEALRVGLINCITTPEKLMESAREIAVKIAMNAPQAVKFSKEAINKSNEMDISSATEFENNLFGLCFSTEDQKEGMRAFLEKRKALFTNK